MKIPAIALFALTATSSFVVRPVRAVGFPGLGQTINGPNEAVGIDPNSATTGTAAGAASSVLRGSSNDGGEAEVGDEVDELRKGGGGTVAGFDATDAKSSCKSSKSSTKTSQLTCGADPIEVRGEVVLTEGLVCDQVTSIDDDGEEPEPAFIIYGDVDCQNNLIMGPGRRDIPTGGTNNDIHDHGVAFRLMPGASLKNCVISGFSRGIHVVGRATIEDVTIMNTWFGIDADDLESGGKFSFKNIRVTNFQYYGIYLDATEPNSEYHFENIDLHNPIEGYSPSGLRIFSFGTDLTNVKISINKLDATGNGSDGDGVIIGDFDGEGGEIKITNSVVQGWGDHCIWFIFDEDDTKVTIKNTLAAGCGSDGIYFEADEYDVSFHASETSSMLNGDNGIHIYDHESDFVSIEGANLSGNEKNGLKVRPDTKVKSTLIQNNDGYGVFGGGSNDEIIFEDDKVKICHNGGTSNDGVHDGPVDFSGDDPVCDKDPPTSLPSPSGAPVQCLSGCSDDSNIAALASCVEITPTPAP